MLVTNTLHLAWNNYPKESLSPLLWQANYSVPKPAPLCLLYNSPILYAGEPHSLFPAPVFEVSCCVSASIPTSLLMTPSRSVGSKVHAWGTILFTDVLKFPHGQISLHHDSVIQLVAFLSTLPFANLRKILYTYDRFINLCICTLIQHKIRLISKDLKERINSPGWCGSVDWVAPGHQRVASLIPSQGTCLGCRPEVPSRGAREATTHWCFSPSLSFSSAYK